MAEFNEKLLAVFEAAHRIHETLFNHGVDQRYLSVGELFRYVAETFGEHIEVKLVDVETSHLYGLIKRFPNKHSVIYLVKHTSLRWRVLVAVKELSHVVLDTQEVFQPDGEDTLRRLATTFIDIHAPENIAIRSEMYAEVLAWELLYPHENRRADKAALANDPTKLTLSHLAARYRIPETIIEDVLAEPYLEMCDRYWAEIFRRRQNKT